MRIGSFPALIACLALQACAHAAPAVQETVFRNISVVPMDSERVLERQTVVVRGDRIVAMAPEGSMPVRGDSKVIDGTGLYLMPGLVDSHTHPGGMEELPSFVAHGQTTILTMHGEGKTLRGAPVIAPNILSTTHTIDAVPPLNKRFHGFTRPADAPALLDAEKRDGADAIKIYGQLSKESFDALVAEGRKRGLPVLGHIPRGFPFADSVSKMAMIAHAEDFFAVLQSADLEEAKARLGPAAKLVAQHGVAVTSNLMSLAGSARHYRHLAEEMRDPELAYLPEPIYQEYLHANNRYSREGPGFGEFQAQAIPILQWLVGALKREGVLMLTGTDAPVFCYPGKCLFQELELLRENGFSNFEALQTATANPGIFAARHFGGPGFGTIAVGKRADLVLLSADPLRSLDALRSVRGTMVSGRWYPAETFRAERERMAGRLKARRAIIDEYERLLAGADRAALGRYVAGLDPKQVTFNANVVIEDAQQIETAGNRAEAIALAEQFARLLPTEWAVWNEVGRLKRAAGDIAGARAAYGQSLTVRPLNGVAADALAAMR